PSKPRRQRIDIALELPDSLGDAIQAPNQQRILDLVAFQVLAERGGDHGGRGLFARRRVRVQLLKEITWKVWLDPDSASHGSPPFSSTGATNEQTFVVVTAVLETAAATVASGIRTEQRARPADRPKCNTEDSGSRGSSGGEGRDGDRKFTEPEGCRDLGGRQAAIEAIRSVLYTFPSADRRLARVYSRALSRSPERAAALHTNCLAAPGAPARFLASLCLCATASDSRGGRNGSRCCVGFPDS